MNHRNSFGTFVKYLQKIRTIQFHDVLDILSLASFRMGQEIDFQGFKRNSAIIAIFATCLFQVLLVVLSSHRSAQKQRVLISVHFRFKQTERQIMGVSFDLNNTVVKIGRAFNAKKNTRFSAAIVKRINNVLSDYL